MCSLQRHNPPESSTMRILGHVLKISKSFRFLPFIYYENNGPHDGQMLCFMAHRSHSKLKTEFKIKCYVLMAHRSYSKLERELKIKCIFMAHRPHSKSKTRIKIKCLILIFSVIFILFHFTFILIYSYFLITLLSFVFYFVLFF